MLEPNPLAASCRDGDRVCECLQLVPDARREEVDVGIAVSVGDRRKVELSGVRERADTEGDFCDEWQQRECLEDRRPGEVERYRRTGQIGGGDIYALTVQQFQESPPDEPAARQFPQGRT